MAQPMFSNCCYKGKVQLPPVRRYPPFWATDFPVFQDLLNKIAPSGMLPHKLTRKEGAPVLLLRNMNGAHGQANGTRMPMRKIHSLPLKLR